jgi:hypothetical protein
MVIIKDLIKAVSGLEKKLKNSIFWRHNTQHNDNLLICDTQHNDTRHKRKSAITMLFHYAECHYDLFIIMLNVVMLSVIMLNVVMLSVIMLKVVILKFVALIFSHQKILG